MTIFPSLSPALLAALSLFGPSALFGQQHALVKDINTKPLELSSSPANYTVVGSTAYFTATTPIHGTELWKTDGSAAGTVLVKDIRPGTDSSSIYSMTDVGGFLFFFADDGVNGLELWKSDGTEAGTVLVKDIRPGSGSGPFYSIAVLAGVAYFPAEDGVNGRELWKSNGTAAGTMIVKDVLPGPTGGVTLPVTAGSLVYFVASTAAEGQELWKTDGTLGGTVLVKDIQPGANSSQIENLTAVGSTVFFTALDGVNARSLWKSNGTAAGTLLVKIADRVTTFTAAGSNLFYIGYTFANGDELWKSDGTAAGTYMVKDIAPGYGSGIYWSGGVKMSVLGSNVYFGASSGGVNYGLWKSDGTSAGTVHLATSGGMNLTRGVIMGGALYIPFGDKIWKTTGTAGSTVSVLPTEFSAATSSIAALGSSVVFSAQSNAGIEPCKSNGTVGNAELIKNISTGTWPSYPESFAAAADGKLYFSADDGVNGKELWKSDGTATGTEFVKDIGPGGSSSMSSSSAKLAVGNLVYFSANNGTNGYELWKSDGTVPGTQMLKDIRPGSASALLSWSAPIGSIGSLVLFGADDGVNGKELWVTDGTEAGTTLLKDINPGASSSNLAESPPVRFGDAWYFSAATNISGNELWRSDGTEAGTYMVADIHPGYSGGLAGGNSSLPISVVLGSHLYFAASDGSNGFELWKTDGSEQGTVMVKNIAPGSASSVYNLSAIALGNAFYFIANDGVNGAELWKSDGTTSGTMMVKNIDATSAASLTSSILTGVASDDTLFFTASDGSNGLELWKTDGTGAGTQMVRDIVPGSGDSDPSYLVRWQNKVYFSASDGAGRELWQSDGTAAGTTVIPDAFIGPAAYSAPEQLIVSNGKVFFSAKQPGAGFDDRELYSYVIPAAPSVATETASGVSFSGASLNGMVLSNNADTNVFFDYGPAGTFGSTIAATPGTVNGTSYTPVGATLTGLLSWTTYSYRLRAVNSQGTTYSSTWTFTTNLLSPGYAEPSFNAAIAGGEVIATAMQPDGKILIGGSFTSVGGISRNRIARLNVDATLDTGFNPNASNNVLAIHVRTDGKILVGGSFGSMGGVTRNGLARLNADGTLDTEFDPNPNAGSWVNAIDAPLGGKVVFGGTFTSVGGVTRNRVARLNLYDTLDTGFNPDANGEVRTLAVLPDGAVMLGGGFSQVGGVTRNGFAKTLATGALDTTYAPLLNVGGIVSCLAVQPDGNIILGGLFSAINSTGRSNLARLSNTGLLDGTFNPNASDQVRCLALQANGRILASGSFNTMGGSTRLKVARLESNGTVDNTFGNAAANADLRGLALRPDGRILAFGAFTSIGGQSRTSLALLANGAPESQFTFLNNDILVWYRNGTAPEATSVTFELSTDSGTTWSSLGPVARNLILPQQWVLTGLSLPNSGLLRATARVTGGQCNGSGGLVTAARSFNSPIPEIFVGIPSDNPVQPVEEDIEIADGGSLDMSGISAGGTKVRSLNIRNLGNAGLTGLHATIDGPDATAFSISTQPTTSIPPGNDFTYVDVAMSSPTPGNKQATLHIASNDQDETPYDIDLSGVVFSKPTVAPSSVTNVTAYAATVNGTVNPNNDNTTVIIEYGNTTAYGALALVNPSSLAGLAPIPVAANLTGLQPDTVYHYRIIASNISGITRSSDQQFTTLPPPPGTVDPSVATNLNDYVFGIAVRPDDSCLITGNFTSINSLSRLRIARFTEAGPIDDTYAPSMEGVQYSSPTHAVAALDDGGALFIGNFTLAAGQLASGLARINADGSPAVGLFAATISRYGNVNFSNSSATVDRNGEFLIAGNFTTVNGVARPDLARLSSNGTLDASYNPVFPALSASSIKRVYPVAGGASIATGTFNNNYGAARTFVAKLDANGAVDNAFTPAEVYGNLYCVTVQADGKVLLGGDFQEVDGQARYGLARLNAQGSLDAAFNPQVLASPSEVHSLILQADGKILLGGFFLGESSPRNHLMRLFADGTLDNNFEANISGTGGDVMGVALDSKGRVLIGGGFSQVGGQNRYGFARLLNDPATQSLTVSPSGHIEWLRGGSSPETHLVTFHLSTDIGITWSPLGAGNRIPGGWSLDTVLPAVGIVRASARVEGGYQNGSSGLVATTRAFSNIAPEITLKHAGTDIANGDAFDFGAVAVGDALVRTFTIKNTGNADLQLTANPVVTVGGADAALFAVTSHPATVISGPDGSTTFSVRLSPLSSGPKTATLGIVNNDGDESVFTITISGTGAAPAQLFAQTMTVSGLSGGNDSPTATPFNDGVENLLKYAFNMNLAGPDLRRLEPGGTGSSGLPNVSLGETGGEPVLRVQFLRRKGSGLVYTPKVSATLNGFSPMTGATVVTSISDAWERVVVEQPCDTATTPQCFGIVEVTLP